MDKFLVNGYYWVKNDIGMWFIAYKNGNDWFCFGSTVECYTSEFAEIGDQVEVPEKYRAIIQQLIPPDN